MDLLGEPGRNHHRNPRDGLSFLSHPDHPTEEDPTLPGSRRAFDHQRPGIGVDDLLLDGSELRFERCLPVLTNLAHDSKVPQPRLSLASVP